MIFLKDVTLSYRSNVETVTALETVTLRVLAGEFVAVFGASGSGKTTLLNVIAGLQVPDSGDVQVGEHEVQHLTESERAQMRLVDVGVVFQDDNLIPEFSALENVMLPLRARGWSATAAVELAQEYLVKVGLDGLGRRMPAQLSGGQKQRVGIARALVGGRRVLLADEPTGALDSETSRAVFELLGELAEQGVAVVVATHDPLVLEYAGRIVTVRDGQVLAVDQAAVAR